MDVFMIEKKTLQFLKNLRDNNSREWFHSHKDSFEEARRNFLDLTMYLISEIEKFDSSVMGVEPEECLFRIHRDTRFSRDKTPYKTNLGSFIKKGGRKIPGAGYYLHISPGEIFLAGGIYMPPSDMLLAIRRAIEKDSGPLKKITGAPDFIREFGSLSGEKLKSAPKGFPRDHPDIELLRFKHYLAVRDVKEKEALGSDFPALCVRTFRAMRDLNRYLNGLFF